MVIQQITLQGFKSFGRKTTFRFDRGVTAIVGPNGSGKSNVADALRWVLGEQSARALRVKKTEDLIFAGTGAKAKASIAEVSVLFDNSAGLVLPELAEIELSRKLYGSGESDYRLNGKKVRLAEVQELLAAARLGVGSYAIIGQGTIDSFILATPAERKLLFEEASGIRHFELQRTSALKRLRATDENMQRARDVLGELGPRLTSLERSLGAAKQRDELIKNLATLKQRVVAAKRTEISESFNLIQQTIQNTESQVTQHSGALAKLDERQKQVNASRKAFEVDQRAAATKLRELEAAREQMLNDISVQQAERQHLEERLGELAEAQVQQKELERLTRAASQHLKVLTGKLASAGADQQTCARDRDKLATSVKTLQHQLVKQRKLLQDGSQHEYVSHAKTIAADLHYALQREDVDKEQLQELTHRMRRLLRLATEGNQPAVIEEIRELQTELGAAIRQREAIDERYTTSTLTMRGLELDVTAAEVALKEHEKQLKLSSKEIAALEKLKTYISQREAAVAKLQDDLRESQNQIDLERDRLGQQSQPVDEAVAIARESEQHKLALEQAQRILEDAQTEAQTYKHQLDQMPKTEPESEPAATLELQVVRSESKLAALEDLGEGISEEYSETKQRHDSLAEQLADLEGAKINLESIIDQLDGAIKEQFTSAFEELSERFSSVFSRLFGGGSARLSLKEDNDQLGVEIEVIPPGKRARHLTALSGGERSLAGLALLAAIVQINPSPLLVLDEVDAALDEANADRFQELLTELAVLAQVIVITHNRQTMIAAGALYGVTMDHEHVSRTVSVQLDEPIPAS